MEIAVLKVMLMPPLWRLLDASVNGPDYGDGRSAPWFKLPTVTQATESDLVRMQEMINVRNDLLTSMQTLVDVEENAREEINKTYNIEPSDAE
jgi:hypothetical protein